MCPSKIEAAYSKSLLFSLYACEQLPGSIAAITFLGSKVRLTPAGLQLALREDWPDISQLQPSWSSPSCHDPSVTESNLPSTANVLQKTFLLLLTSPTHLNSSSVLAFPVWSLHAQVRLLYPSQQPAYSYFHLPCSLLAFPTHWQLPDFLHSEWKKLRNRVEDTVPEEQPTLLGLSPSEQPPIGYLLPVS